MQEFNSVEKQIENLLACNMKFNDISIVDAKNILTNSTYYHKVVSYKHLFSLYKSNKYDHENFNGIDFNDVYELMKIDVELRECLNDICLDVEHYFKVLLMKKAESLKDAYFYYDIVDIDSRYHINAKMKKRMKDYNDTYSAKMIKKFPDKKPIWVLNEYLSFGEVIEILSRYSKYNKTDEYDFLIELLLNAKSLRNITVHNNKLFNSKFYSYEDVSKLIDAYKTNFNVVIEKDVINNHLMANLFSTIYVYKTLAMHEEFKKRIDKLFKLLHDFIKNYKLINKYKNENFSKDIINIYKIINKLY